MARLMETYKRRKAEDKIEFKILRGITQTAEKLLKPFKSAWDGIWEFISTVLFGRIMFKLIKWLGDTNNQDKIKSVFRFLKDWWPSMLAAYLLFGNSLTKFVVKLLAKVGVWIVTSIPAMIKALAAAIVKLKSMKFFKALLGGGKGLKALKVAGIVGGGAMLTDRILNPEDLQTGAEGEQGAQGEQGTQGETGCLLYTSPSPRDS